MGISTFSTAESREADIFVRVSGMATLKSTGAAEKYEFTDDFLCTLFDFKNTAVSINAQNSPVVIPVTAAAQAYSIPFEKKNGYSIITVAILITCSKTCAAAG